MSNIFKYTAVVRSPSHEGLGTAPVRRPNLRTSATPTYGRPQHRPAHVRDIGLHTSVATTPSRMPSDGGKVTKMNKHILLTKKERITLC
jgi:hypothetical protein